MNYLNTGCLKEIFSNLQIKQSITLQLIDFQNISSDNKQQFKLIVSDGEFWTNLVLLSTHLNKMLNSKKFVKYNLFEVRDLEIFAINNSSGSGEVLIIFIKAITKIHHDRNIDEIIGFPKRLLLNESDIFNINPLNDNKSIEQLNDTNQNANNTDLKLLSIKDLKSGKNKWLLKARVSEVYPMKT